MDIDSAIAEYSTFLPSKTPELLLLYVLGHCPFVLWSAARSALLHLTESVQRVYLYMYRRPESRCCADRPHSLISRDTLATVQPFSLLVSVCLPRRRSRVRDQQGKQGPITYTLQNWSGCFRLIIRATGSQAMPSLFSMFHRWCFDHELFQAISILFSPRHSGTGWS